MNKDFIYEEQKQLIEMWKNKYYEQKEKLEQLEKELKEEQKDNYKQSQLLVEKQQKIEQLENNRDKAIEYIENGEILNTWGNYRPFKEFGYGKDLLNILKGDSDE